MNIPELTLQFVFQIHMELGIRQKIGRSRLFACPDGRGRAGRWWINSLEGGMPAPVQIVRGGSCL
jgi:hypothetical protein